MTLRLCHPERSEGSQPSVHFSGYFFRHVGLAHFPTAKGRYFLKEAEVYFPFTLTTRFTIAALIQRAKELLVQE